MAKEKEVPKSPEKKKSQVKNRDLKAAKDPKGGAQKKEGPTGDSSGGAREIDFMKKWD